MRNPKSILITGGSGGIGKGLCVFYAAPGVTVSFTGRDEKRIGEVAALIRNKGANVNAAALDVTDGDAMKLWIEKIDDIAPLDLVIANAGIGEPQGSIEEKTARVFNVNVSGVFNTVHPALERMRKRRRGQIAIVSSIAAYMGFPWSPAYSASKAAVKIYGEGLRSRYRDEGIEITVICPGVVHTPMTESHYKDMPGWLTVDRAVRIIVKRLERNPRLIAFPWYTHVLARWASGLPAGLQDSLMRVAMRKATRMRDDPKT